MTDRDTLKRNPEEAVFDILSDTRVGMLGVEGNGQHLQPMTHFADAESASVWFITSRQTDLAKSVASGQPAQHCVSSKDQSAFASLTGTLQQIEDDAKLEELWSPVVAAWFPEGRKDPDVCLLRLKLDQAAIWVATSSALNFGFEIARANLVADHQPDVGDHEIVRFG